MQKQLVKQKQLLTKLLFSLVRIIPAYISRAGTNGIECIGAKYTNVYIGTICAACTTGKTGTTDNY